MRTSAGLRLALVLSIGFVAGACGDSRQAPSGPSPVAAASTSPASGNSTASGVFSSTHHSVSEPASAADTEGVEGEGRVTSLVAGTACPTLQFVVEGITVKTSAATSFEGGTCLDIKAGTKIEAKGTRQADGSVLASRIKIKEREIETVEGEGRVTSLVAGTACPTKQFVVEGITVKTSAATSFEGGTCLDIKAGTKVEAKGTRQVDGSVLASRIKIKEREIETVEGEGRVTSLVAGTACPTLQFVVEGVTVKTSAATSFEGGTCLDIKAGTKIEAKGTRQADGSVLASRIKIKEREPEVEGEGRVTSLVAGTACPTLQFVVEGITVKATAATLYERGTCADVQPGVLVHVKGTALADGTVAALVRIQENKVEGEGRIASVVSGTVCPARTFVVDTVTVTTDAATVYERGACADLQPGVHVHVRGTRRANDTVLASLVRVQD